MNLIKILLVLIGLSTSCYAQNVEYESKKVNALINYFVESDSTIIDEKYQIVNEFNPGIDAPPEWYINESIFSKLNSSFDLRDSLYYFNYFDRVKDIKLELTKNKNKYQYIDKKVIGDYIIQNEIDYKNGIKYDFYEEFEKRIGMIQAFGLPIISKDGNYLLLAYVKYGPSRKVKKFLRLYKKQEDHWLHERTIFEYTKQL